MNDRRTQSSWSAKAALLVTFVGCAPAPKPPASEVPVITVGTEQNNGQLAEVDQDAEPEDRDVALPPLAKRKKASNPQSVAAAKKMFRAALVAFQQGRYLEARDGFLQAYALSPEPPLLFNAANAAFKANHRQQACQLYADYLSANRGSGRPLAKSALARQCGHHP